MILFIDSIITIYLKKKEIMTLKLSKILSLVLNRIQDQKDALYLGG